MKVGVVTFPGSLDDGDALRRGRARRWRAGRPLARRPRLKGVEAVILPGGFSYGDYLAAGRSRGSRRSWTRSSPRRMPACPCSASATASRFCARPPPAGRADPQRPSQVRLPRPAAADRERRTAWTSSLCDRRRDRHPAQERRGRLRRRRRHARPSSRARGESSLATSTSIRMGLAADIAGIANKRGNVVGLMPHPEHAVDALTGPGTDGLGFFASMIARSSAA